MISKSNEHLAAVKRLENQEATNFILRQDDKEDK